MIDRFDLPQLKTFIAGNRSFYKTTSLSLSSDFFIIVLLYLPQFTTFKPGCEAFFSTRRLSLSSINRFIYLSDVPFTGGTYTQCCYNNGECTFNALSSSGISSDSGFPIDSLSLLVSQKLRNQIASHL